MHIHLLTLLLASTLFACSGGRNSARKAPAREPTPALVPVVKYGGEGRSDSLFLSLERTPCFGTCPAYRIHLYRSGYATYEGRAHVEKEGMHEARVGRDTLAMLLKEAERINFFDLDDVYDSPVTDLPSTIVRVAGNGREKRVVGRVGAPPRFIAFAAYIDGLLMPMPWMPVVALD